MNYVEEIADCRKLVLEIIEVNMVIYHSGLLKRFE